MVKIGVITAFNAEKSIWGSGIHQNTLFLIDVLKNSTFNYEVHALNLYEYKIEKYGIAIEYFLPIYLKMDIIIIIGGLLPNSCLYKCKKLGIKLVSYKCGNDYLIEMERCLFSESKKIEIFQEFDECWYVPQQHENNEWYYKKLYKTVAFPVPFIWSPKFIKDISLPLKNYKKNYQKKRIAIMEPNINTVKYCFIPLLIVDEIYSKKVGKDKIDHLYITNGMKLKTQPLFNSLCSTLDIFKDGKVTAEGRYNTSVFLHKHADIVVSHQNLNPLNYLYLDIAYLGYPIIHNAYLCKNIGYFYEKFDVGHGAKMLEEALITHDENKEKYIERNHKEINKYLVTNPDVINCYDLLIHGLFKNTNMNLIYDFNTNFFL
jgi:hypothetical protein